MRVPHFFILTLTPQGLILRSWTFQSSTTRCANGPTNKQPMLEKVLSPFQAEGRGKPFGLDCGLMALETELPLSKLVRVPDCQVLEEFESQWTSCLPLPPTEMYAASLPILMSFSLPSSYPLVPENARNFPFLVLSGPKRLLSLTA